MSRYNSTFLGIQQQHNYLLYEVLDTLLLSRPDIKNFIEIGTGHGALAVILGLHAFMRKGKCITFDPQKRKGLIKVLPLLNYLSIRQIADTCFSDSSKTSIEIFCKEPCLIFCDGDDKLLECNTFSKVLNKGSFILCHDYGFEFSHDDIMKVAKQNNLTAILQNDWLKVQTCFFIKE